VISQLQILSLSLKYPYPIFHYLSKIVHPPQKSAIHRFPVNNETLAFLENEKSKIPRLFRPEREEKYESVEKIIHMYNFIYKIV
jgi:hypothetical protein